ncbi:MAG: sigma-70 family RNA polymerase sigma factor [Candidatus Aureabacteria bacterium]|nr:sigma-70 family RNA polymerase sigma factor [Candidatus Auribacterota bacterium]
MNGKINVIEYIDSGTDEYLIRSFLENKPEAFDTLITRYKNRIFNLCYRFLGHHEDANDCAQETFIKACKHLKNFKFQSSFYTWLYTIAVNTCKNRLNSREMRHRKYMFSTDQPVNTEDGMLMPELKSTGPTPFVQTAQKEEDKQIQEEINALSEDYKTIILLRDIEGFSYDEIASITNLKMGTVKSKIARARDVLKEKLKRRNIL